MAWHEVPAGAYVELDSRDRTWLRPQLGKLGSMKTTMWLFLVVVGCALAACSPQQQQSASNAATQDYHIAQKQSLDAALDVRVTAAIATQAGVNTFHVAPLAHNGVVTLTGTAPSHEVDRVIVQTVRAVPGVKKVVDQISVR